MGSFCNFGDFCALKSLNYDPPFLEYIWKNSTSYVNNYVLVYFYKSYFSEEKFIKAILLTPSKAKKAFLSNNVNIEA